MDIDDACCATRNTEEIIHLTRDFHQLNDVKGYLSVSGNDYHETMTIKASTGTYLKDLVLMYHKERSKHTETYEMARTKKKKNRFRQHLEQFERLRNVGC